MACLAHIFVDAMGLGFRGSGFRGLGFRGLGFWVLIVISKAMLESLSNSIGTYYSGF